jgi:hypothetical protein
VHSDTIQKKLCRRGHMTMLENTIDADTEALQMVR